MLVRKEGFIKLELTEFCDSLNMRKGQKRSRDGSKVSSNLKEIVPLTKMICVRNREDRFEFSFGHEKIELLLRYSF